MNPEFDWHARFSRQATWTLPLRQYLYHRVGVGQAHSVLEVGCGTGAILQDIMNHSKVTSFGFDIDPSRLAQSHLNAPHSRLTCGDAHHLPYQNGYFPITFCHFLLMWVRKPVQVLREMRRVTSRGGAILVLAEPDYRHRRDFPQELGKLGKLQTQSLRDQGADPDLGGRLPELFAEAGIPVVETGMIQSSGPETNDLTHWESEWSQLRLDLNAMIPPEELDRIQELDRQAFNNGQHVNFIPTHFAWGVA